MIGTETTDRRTGARLAFALAPALAAVAVAAAGPVGPRPALAQETAAAADPSRVEELERRFLDRVGDALHLDDEQRRRLADEMERSREERRGIAEREAAVRRRLVPLVRGQRDADASAEVDRLLEELVDLHVERAELLRSEQQRLASFLSPLERARFLYLRHRLVQAIRERGGAAAPGRLPERRGGAGARPPPAARRDVPRGPRP